MFTLIYYEFKKIFSRSFLVSILSIFCVYFVITYLQIKNDTPHYYEIYDKSDIAVFYETYKNDCADIDNRYDELLQEISLLQENSATEDEIVNKKIVELSLYQKLYEDVGRKQTILAEIDEVLLKAWRTKQTYDIEKVSKSEPIYHLQEQVIQIYTSVRENLRVGFEHLCGWSIFFRDANFSGYLYIVLLFLLIINFQNDKENNSILYIGISKNGKYKTLTSRLILHGLIIFFGVLLTESARLLIVDKIIGLSSPLNAIHSFNMFSLYPYSTSILMYLLRYLLWKFLICLFCYSMGLLFYCYIGNIIMFLPTYFLIFCGQYIINKFEILPSTNSVFGITEFLSQYRYFYFGKYFCSADTFLTFFFILVIVICIISIYFIYYGRKLRKIHLPLYCISIQKIHLLRPSHTYSLGLFQQELYKQLTYNKKYALILLVFICIGVMQNQECKEHDTYMEKAFETYINSYSGEVTEDKIMLLESEVVHISNVLGNKDIMEDKYRNQEIDRDAYHSYIVEYLYATTNQQFANYLVSKAEYFAIKSQETGNSGTYLYEKGYQLFFENDSTDILMIITVLLAMFSYKMEYNINGVSFYNIQCTTKYGRKNTFIAKIKALLFINTNIIMIYQCIRYLIIGAYFPFTYKNASLFCISGFEEANNFMKAGNTILLSVVIQILLFNCILVCLVCLFSQHKISFIGNTVCILSWLPIFLRRIFNIQVFEIFDMPQLCTITSFINYGWKIIIFICGLVLLSFIFYRFKIKEESSWN